MKQILSFPNLFEMYFFIEYVEISIILEQYDKKVYILIV